MRTSILSVLKPIALSVVAVAIMGLAQGVANADEVFISGYTNGCFNCATPPDISTGQTGSLFALMYVNSTSSGTTVGGFRDLGGNPLAPPVQNVNNLGAFQLASSMHNYNGNTFTLRVTFTAGSNSQVFSAVLTGAVSGTGGGGVFINFDNTPILFTFSDSSGSFFFAVNDLSITPGQVADLTGQITGAQQLAMPEPATMLLFGTGLAGVAAVARRKLKGRSK